MNTFTSQASHYVIAEVLLGFDLWTQVTDIDLHLSQLLGGMSLIGAADIVSCYTSLLTSVQC